MLWILLGLWGLSLFAYPTYHNARRDNIKYSFTYPNTDPDTQKEFTRCANQGLFDAYLGDYEFVLLNFGIGILAYGFSLFELGIFNVPWRSMIFVWFGSVLPLLVACGAANVISEMFSSGSIRQIKEKIRLTAS